jgi:hypothetical protein
MMKFEPANRNADGTSLQGYTPKTTYLTLVEVFGQPQYGPDFDGDKTTCGWALRFADGVIATIYDYKEWATPQDNYAWHIGGTDERAVQRVNEWILGR